MTSEPERIDDQLRRACEGRAWHGPSLKELLSGVDARQAAAKPVPGGHSIWEIVLHLAAWEDAACRRLAGEVVRTLPPAEDWPPPAGREAADWAAAREQLERCHRRLHDALALLPAERLAERLPSGETVYILLHGVVQHDLYHAGQIALLKKMPVP